MPEMVSYPAEVNVIRQGSAGDRYFLIAKGEVEIYEVTPTGESLPLRTLHSGEHFGEIALLKGIPRTASVRTLMPCEFLVFSREEFFSLLQQSPRLSESLSLESSFLLRASQLEHTEASE